MFAISRDNRLKAYESLEKNIRDLSPLIVIGMHRSGTSLTVRLLADLGMHMGNRLSRDEEAIYFQKLNRKIYRTTGSNWGFVDPLLNEFKSKAFIYTQADQIIDTIFFERNIFNRSIKKFFGSALWQDIQRQKPVSWGWKDPRTTITFPIWLSVFPNARILHLLRNGIDVAISIHRRTIKQKRTLWKQIIPLDYCPQTLDFKYCFGLWEKHIRHVMAHLDTIQPENYLEIRYEDLLTKPEEMLTRIANFVELPFQQDELFLACRQIDRNRLDNSKFAETYQNQIPKLAESSTMQLLNYSYPMSFL